MLVLTRKVGQVITLGNPLSPDKAIEILVTDVQGAEVKLGVTAPLEIPVHRHEIWEQKKQEERDAEAQALGQSHSIGAASAPF